MISRVDLFYLPPSWLEVAYQMYKRCRFESWSDGKILVEAERLVELLETFGQQPQLFPWYECDGLRPIEKPYPCTKAGEPDGARDRRHQDWQQRTVLLYIQTLQGRWPIEQFVLQAKELIAAFKSELEAGLIPQATTDNLHSPLDRYPLKHAAPGYRWM